MDGRKTVFQFENGVNDEVRAALAADPNYEHPNYIGEGHWFWHEDDNGVSHGSVYGRVVGVESENDPVLTRLTLLVESSGHVVTVARRDVFDSKDESDEAYSDWENDW